MATTREDPAGPTDQQESKEMNKNEGISISGSGQLHATNLAAGPKARAVTYAHHPDAEQATRGPERSREDLARNVFVIHGRDSQARLRMFDLLRRMDLHPLEWESIVQEVGVASPYLGEVVRSAFDIAQAALVLLTPDDIVRLHPSLQESPSEEIRECQARPNVLFEAAWLSACTRSGQFSFKWDTCDPSLI